MAKIIKQYCTRQLAKQRKQNPGLYTPPSMPHSPWEDISIGIVLELAKTSRQHDSILVFVDCFSKIDHFFLALENLGHFESSIHFLWRGIRLHGVPKTVVLDRDVKFTSYFWKTLWIIMGTKLWFSSASPTNKWPDWGCEQKCIRSWDSILPTAESAYNSLVNRSIGMSPFEAVLRYGPRAPIDLIPISSIHRPFASTDLCIAWWDQKKN